MRNAAQRGPQFAGPTPRSRRGPPPRPAEGFCPRAGPARSTCLCAYAGAQSTRPDQMPASLPQGVFGQAIRGAVSQGRRGGEPAIFHSSFVPSTAPPDLAAAAASPHPRTGRRPARSRRAPAAHRSREACRPACRSVRAPQVAALNGSAVLRPLTAGDAASLGPRSHRRRSAVRPVYKPPARCPCTARPALVPAAPRASGDVHKRRICQA